MKKLYSLSIVITVLLLSFCTALDAFAQTAQTITFPDLPVATYGNPDITLTASSNSGLPVTYSTSNATIATIVGGKVHLLKSGTVNIYADQPGGSGFNAASRVTKPLVIGQKVITAELKNPTGNLNVSYNGTKVVPFSNFTGSFNLIGLVAGDVISVTCNLTFATKDAGLNKTYTTTEIVLTGAHKDDYVLTPFSGTKGWISPKGLTVTLPASIDKPYDGSTAVPTFTPTGIIGSDDVTLTLTGVYNTKDVGTAIPITMTSVLAGADKGNYFFNSISGKTGNITKAPLTITPNSVTKTYGQSLIGTTGSTAFTTTGLVAPETVGNITIAYETGATANSAVNTYAGSVVPSTLTAGTYNPNNYNIIYTPGTLTVNKAPLKITAVDQVKFVNTANPPLTVNYEGFVNGESNLVLTTQPLTTTAANTASPIGSYPITVSGTTADNYQITHVNGTLMVNIYSEAPSAITFAPVDLYENSAAASAGTLSSPSLPLPGIIYTYTYTLATGAGATDNALFTINGNSIKTIAGLDFENKSTYQVRVRSTTQYGLWSEQAFTINLKDVNDVPTLAAINDQAICYTPIGQTVALNGISAGQEAGQTTTLSVSSDNSTLFESLTIAGTGATGTLSYTLKSGAKSGIANITVTVKDNGGTENGGVDTYSRTFVLTVNALTVVTINSDKGTTISRGEKMLLTAKGGDSYEWENSAGIISKWRNLSTLEVRPSETTTYSVTSAPNANGCQTVQRFTVTVLDDLQSVKATNIMSPNGDGINDKWTIDNLDLFPNNLVKIFDKSGRMIYSKKGYDNSWDATLNGMPLSKGTYYYIVDFGTKDKVIRGAITIVRED
jgi:gliding motility-associated-like protein